MNTSTHLDRISLGSS